MGDSTTVSLACVSELSMEELNRLIIHHRHQLNQLEEEQTKRKLQQSTITSATQPSLTAESSSSSWYHGLTPTQISRYSRQLILSEFGGSSTQQRLLASKVLIVGAGGLGAPVALYLAAAGVGHMKIVDGDEVELSNLHRQVIHTEGRIGQFKAESAKLACQQLNGDCKVEAICQRFDETNAIQLASDCDLIIDASDNVPTRYLCNDVAVTCGKVLVSGSALRMEGQVSVFGMPDGPCYRCLYPQPPPPASVTNCSDGGVIGAVTGVIGSIQAMEAIKILGGLIENSTTDPPAPTLSPSSTDFDPASAARVASTFSNRLLLFDGQAATFRIVKLRPRNKSCAVCGEAPTITRATLETNSFDYQFFCSTSNHDGPQASNKFSVVTNKMPVPTASVEDLRGATNIPSVSSSSTASISNSSSSLPSSSVLVIDVREPVQYRICALPNAINVPLRVLKREIPTWIKQLIRAHVEKAVGQNNSTNESSTSLIAPQSTTPHPSLHPSLPSPFEVPSPPSSISSASPSDSSPTSSSPLDIFVLCRRGIDSQTATRLLLKELEQQMSEISQANTSSAQTVADETQSDSVADSSLSSVAASNPFDASSVSSLRIRHVRGGLQSWSEKIQPTFPLY